jgi:hypothetical protein
MDSFHKLTNLKAQLSLNANLDMLTEINKMAEEEFENAKKSQY